MLRFLLGLYAFFCSLKMAVCTLSVLILIFIVGTVYESLYGTTHAQELIYQSLGMTIALAFLFLNIFAVMLDRLPWKKRHIPFLLAHFGILFIIIGAFLTRFYGVDGSLRLALEEKAGYIHTPSSVLLVYSSFDAQNMTELYREKVSFLRHRPTLENSYAIQLGSHTLQVIDYHPAALFRENYEPAERGGVAVRFQVEGSRAHLVKWLFKPPLLDQVTLSLGPAQVVLLDSFDKFKETNQPSLLLKPDKMGLQYQIRTGQSQEHSSKIKNLQLKKIKKSFLNTGSVLETGWMDLKFRILSYLPQALPDLHFTPQEKVSDRTVPAIQLNFKGQTKWMALNSHLYFFDEDKVFVVAYVNERKNLPFQLQLKNFQVFHYPSSNKASSYESEVLVNQETVNRRISMNEPLKLAGYTVYQSGFEENDEGIPQASVFAINKDPGRFLKYGGSLLIILGTFLLFLKRNRRLKHSQSK